MYYYCIVIVYFRFEYGGCAGNTNNFFTKAECERRCAVNDEASRRLFQDGQTGEAGPGAVITTERGMTRPRGARTEGSWVAGGAGAATAGKDICLLPEETGNAPLSLLLMVKSWTTSKKW